MRHPSRLIAVGILLIAAALSIGNPALAVEVGGTIRLVGGNSEINDEVTDLLDENYTITLVQPVTPWLAFTAGYRYKSQTSTPEDGPDFERRAGIPEVLMTYSREKFSARVGYEERRIRGTSTAARLDASSFTTRLTLRPNKGPLATLVYRDETNFSDVAVFGRDIGTRTLDLDIGKDFRNWGAWYGYSTVDLDNRSSGLQLNQDQHELRGNYRTRMWDDRMLLSATGQIRHVRQTETIPAGTAFDQPVPARAGLFSVDTVPQVATLDPAPALIDGDTETPVSPATDIGGANTFRNIGVDLGFIRQVSQLEITVNRLSGTAVAWEVYHSPDNLNWERIGGVLSTWDQAFLRYAIRFPETADQYFKAVNISANPESGVLVTEIRALIEVGRVGRTDRESTRIRSDLTVMLRPNERVDASFNLGIDDEDDLITGISNQGLRNLYYSSNVGVELAPAWHLGLRYNFNNLEEDRQLLLQRNDKEYGAALRWSPLPAVDGDLNVSHREETERGTPLRSSDTARLRFVTELFPELLVTSELILTDTDNRFGGFTQTGWSWRETLISRPTRYWTLSGSFVRSDYDSTGTVNLNRRDAVSIQTGWTPVPALYLGATWALGRDDSQNTRDKRYNLSWSPGRKFFASVAYNSYNAVGLRRVTSYSSSLEYRLISRFRLFMTGSRSREEQAGLPEVITTSLRAGVQLAF